MKIKTILDALNLMALSVLLFVTACSSSELAPPISFDDGYLNRQIILNAPSVFNTFSTKDAISVEITNTSLGDIVFKNNYGIRLFLESNNEWVEIAEVPTTRLPEGDVVLSPKATEITYIMPDLPQGAGPFSLRIYVFGNTKGENEYAIAAFTDLKLSP